MFNETFENNNTTARIKAILAILDPKTFPTAKSEEPLNAESTETINSGADVANETTVNPTIIFGIFNLREKFTEELSNQSQPFIKITKPKNNNKYSTN